MSTLLANQAIQAAFLAVLLALAALIGAWTNYWNTRTRIMEQGRQIADLQRQTLHLDIAQQIQAATPAAAQPPTIVTVPAAPSAPSSVPPGPADG